jgi:addiction module RelB/DinJ family antitoxin
MSTVQLRARIDSDLKRKSDLVLKSLGLDASTFVSLSLTQLVNRRGLPFAVTVSDEDYFSSEYGLVAAEKRSAGRRMKRETARARATGKLREISTVDDLGGA